MNEDADNKNESLASAKLTAAFKSLRRDTIFVPPSVDEAIIRESREHFQKVRQMPVVAIEDNRERRETEGRASVSSPRRPWLATVVEVFTNRGPARWDRRALPRLAWWAGLAASVVALGWAGALFLKTPTHLAVRDDVNGDGRVDILDAYALARTIEQGRADRRWDLNGDGMVDELDVNWIASHVVQIVETPEEKRAGGFVQPTKEVLASRPGLISRVGARS